SIVPVTGTRYTVRSGACALATSGLERSAAIRSPTTTRAGVHRAIEFIAPLLMFSRTPNRPGKCVEALASKPREKLPRVICPANGPGVVALTDRLAGTSQQPLGTRDRPGAPVVRRVILHIDGLRRLEHLLRVHDEAHRHGRGGRRQEEVRGGERDAERF